MLLEKKKKIGISKMLNEINAEFKWHNNLCLLVIIILVAQGNITHIFKEPHFLNLNEPG